jgi:2-oxoglutarate ferredoxin oxidoreductase subunit delta
LLKEIRIDDRGGQGSEYVLEAAKARSLRQKRARSTMGKIVIDEEYCKGCGLCIAFCPKGNIRISSSVSRKGYHPAEFLDPSEACTGCAMCALMCPDAAITVYRSKLTGEKK